MPDTDAVPSPDTMRTATGITPGREAIVTRSALAELARSAERALEAFGKTFAPVFAAVQASLHKSAYSSDRKHARRCPTCNASGFPKPLAINGHEYRRRRRNRR